MIKSNTDTKLYIRKQERVISEHIAIQTNGIISGSKTSSLIATLFAIIPIKVELRRLSSPLKTKKKLWSLSQTCAVHFKKSEPLIVYTIFYSTNKDLITIDKAIAKHEEFFGYTYIREMLKIVKNHHTTQFYNFLSLTLTKHNLPRLSHYTYIQLSSDLGINNLIRDIYYAVGRHKIIDKLLNYQVYNGGAVASDVDNLIAVVKDLNLTRESMGDDYELLQTDEYEVVKFTDYSLENDQFDEVVYDIAENLTTGLTNGVRGTATAGIFEDVFKSSKVKKGQLKNLRKAMIRQVNEKTESFTVSWSGLNSIYLKRFKAPKKSYTSKSVKLILSIDQSGSMGTGALEKLLGLFEEIGKKITSLTVHIHDTEISKTFQLESVTGVMDSPGFTEALATRYQSGGTSHYAVFEELAKLTPDQMDETIYFSYSDNYSDIPKAWRAFPQLKQMVSYFINPVDNPVNIPGRVTNIHLLSE